MSLHNHVQLTISQADGLFPRQSSDTPQGKAEEALYSHIIVGFEEALALGMSPMEALGHILCWVASEMARIEAGQGPQSAAATPSAEDH